LVEPKSALNEEKYVAKENFWVNRDVAQKKEGPSRTLGPYGAQHRFKYTKNKK
jgi:hypothetical protein